MCLRYNAKDTEALKADPKPLTLYKAYTLVGGPPRLAAPFKSYNPGGNFAEGGTLKVDPPWKWTYWHDQPGRLLTVETSTGEVCDHDADGKNVNTPGFHCFVNKEDAEAFAHEYRRGNHWETLAVVEVQSHTDYLIAAGTTPSDTVTLTRHEHVEWPTIVLTQITVSQNEFTRAKEEMERQSFIAKPHGSATA